MKARKTKPTNPEHPDASLPYGGRAPLGRGKWPFRLAALAVPLVLLAALEVLLRLFDFGSPVGFFLKTQINGRSVLIPNDRFGERYFPAGLARTPQPGFLPAVKGADTTRLFVFGESAAMGDPEPAFGFTRILEVLLEHRCPGRQFEVVNVAVTAINSHVIRDIARECAAREGDIWIVYMGNNEVVGPFGAGTVFGAQTPPRSVIRARLALKATRVGQLVDAIAERLAGATKPAQWAGMEMFLKQQVRQDDRRMPAVYANFSRNLDDVLDAAQSCGAKVLLSTVVSSLKDCPPFASLPRLSLTGAERADWQKFYRAGVGLDDSTNHLSALAQYERAARIDDTHAELEFRRGRCSLALGDFAEARKRFERARDLDTLRFRADTRINELIRSAARRRAGSGLKLVDADEQFSRESPNRLTGDEWLYEHVHFNFSGNYLLARTFAEHLSGWLPQPGATTGSFAEPVWLTEAECAQRLALTDWDRAQMLDEVCKRLQEPPFTHQLGHTAQLQRWQAARLALKSAAEAAGVGPPLEIYRLALAQRPEDWVLHENLARLLQGFGDLAGAEAAWRKVLGILPHYEQAWYGLGNVLDTQGKSSEAVACFKEALRRKPRSVEAMNGLALALASQRRGPEAMRQLERAIQLKADFVEARVNLGQALARSGRLEEAKTQYLAALRYNSNSAPAHINLGKLLAEQGLGAEAVAHYREAVRAAPDNAVAQYNLGNALGAQGSTDALAHYAAAVRHNPEFFEARYNLGLGLARQGRNTEALSHLREAVRLRPDVAEAHLNLGVAFAKERLYREAMHHFQETLRLDPGNEAARKFLQQAAAFQAQ